MIYDLPKKVLVGGAEYRINSDYRPILDICVAMNDPELDSREKAIVALDIFYPDFGSMPASDYEEALERCFWFVNCGSAEEPRRKTPKLMDWEQDFQYIVAPINRVIGQEIRGMDYLHWWSFISAYYEIGDCLFAQVVSLRGKKAKGKKLDKAETEFYRANRDLVDLKTRYTEAEQDIMAEWGLNHVDHGQR